MWIGEFFQCVASLHLVSSACYLLQDVLACFLAAFFCMYFHAQQPFAPQCQDCVSEVCLMEVHSVQLSAAKTYSEVLLVAYHEL